MGAPRFKISANASWASADCLELPSLAGRALDLSAHENSETKVKVVLWERIMVMVTVNVRRERLFQYFLLRETNSALPAALPHDTDRYMAISTGRFLRSQR